MLLLFQLQSWGLGLPHGAAAPGCRASTLLCLQSAWAVGTGPLSPPGMPHVPSPEPLLGGGCKHGNGEVHAGPPGVAEQALPSVVSCKEQKAVLRMSGNAMRCDAEDMPVSPADPRFPLTFSTSYECLWWHWAVGTVAAGPVPAQGSGSRGCHGPGTRGGKYRSYSVMCWQLSQIPVSQS